MLVSALAATLVGFGLLVVALVTGTLWLAVACIVVCIAGAFLLLADVLGLGEPIARRLTSRGRTRPEGMPVDTHEVDGAASAEPSSTEVTTEMARVDAEIVSYPSTPATTGPPPDTAPVLPSHHARHGEPEEPDDDHAHVRRDESGRPAEVFRLSHTPHHSRHSATADAADPEDPDATGPASTGSTSTGSTDEVPHSRHRSRD